MDVMVSGCAGIDIGKADVVVCQRVPGARGKRVSQVRTFSTVAGLINRLADPDPDVLMLDEGIGHWPQIEAPDTVLTHLLDHIERVMKHADLAGP